MRRFSGVLAWGFVFYTSVLCGVTVFAQGKPNYASDDNKLNGDHLKLRTNGRGFKVEPATAEGNGGKDSLKCAPANSELTVITAGDTVTVRFYEVPSEETYKTRANKWGITQWFASRGESLSTEDMQRALQECKGDARVNTYTAYSITRDNLDKIDYRRTGITFGGLTVPFKYRLGGDRGIVASTTVAPSGDSSWGAPRLISFTLAFFLAAIFFRSPIARRIRTWISGGCRSTLAWRCNLQVTEAKVPIVYVDWGRVVGMDVAAAEASI